jgi:hypothetical protein
VRSKIYFHHPQITSIAENHRRVGGRRTEREEKEGRRKIRKTHLSDKVPCIVFSVGQCSSVVWQSMKLAQLPADPFTQL